MKGRLVDGWRVASRVNHLVWFVWFAPRHGGRVETISGTKFQQQDGAWFSCRLTPTPNDMTSAPVIWHQWQIKLSEHRHWC